MNDYRETIEHMANRWKSHNKSRDGLPATYNVMRAVYWSSSVGGRSATLSELAKEFLSFGAAQKQAEINSMLSERDYCGGCQQTYRIENLSLCTQCDQVFCSESEGSHPNGNRRCRCGGELVG